MIDRLKITYLRVCWLPVGLYLLADFYIATFEGWGQWALGIVVLPTLLLSVAFLGIGLWVISDSYQRRQPLLKLVLATALSGSIFFWFLGRSLLQNF